MAQATPILFAQLLKRSTTECFTDSDHDADVDGVHFDGAHFDGARVTATFNHQRRNHGPSLPPQTALRLKMTQSTGYGSTKRRQMQRKFTVSEQHLILFLRAVVSNIIQPLKSGYSKLPSHEVTPLNDLFDTTLSLFRFHVSSFHQLCSNLKKSSPNKSKPPIFRYYAKFPNMNASYFDAAFKALPHISSIASQTRTKKWLQDKCRCIMLLSDRTNTIPYKSFAAIIRDICTNCINQSKTLKELASSRHYANNREARDFKNNLLLRLEKLYIRQWNDEYKQQFDLLHLEMTLTETHINSISTLQITEDQCAQQITKLNHKMLSLQKEFEEKTPSLNITINNKVDTKPKTLSITISDFNSNNNNVSINKAQHKKFNEPTPVSDEAMFKYFNKIDMGKQMISSLDIFQDEEICFSPSLSTQFEFNNSDGNSSADYPTPSEEEDSEEDDSDDDDDGFSFMAFLTDFSSITEDTVYAEHGYKKLNKICDTIQGSLLKAQEMSSNQYVVIKQADKALVEANETIKDDIQCFVSENRIKEGWILKYLTVNDIEISDYLIKYIDYFETDDDCYLVMEYIESGINLKQFVQISHKYIKENKLKRSEYIKCIKDLLWELVMTVDWLHNTMHCCHLDLCAENIMLKDCSFIEQKDGYLMINPKTSMKLGDFGVAEIFSTQNDFECTKQDLSIDNEAFLAPKIRYDDIYDARSGDMWSVGMILFYVMTGEKLYKAVEVAQAEIKPEKRRSITSLGVSLTSLLSTESSASKEFLFNGYWSLHHGKLKEYLTTNGKVQHFDRRSFQLLIELLKINEKTRINASAVLKHSWFTAHYQKYEQLINNSMQTQEIKDFPFYKM